MAIETTEPRYTNKDHNGTTIEVSVVCPTCGANNRVITPALVPDEAIARVREFLGIVGNDRYCDGCGSRDLVNGVMTAMVSENDGAEIK